MTFSKKKLQYKIFDRVRRKQLQWFGRVKGMDTTRILKSALERNLKETDLWDNPKQDGSTKY
jgi:hypothetical protein